MFVYVGIIYFIGEDLTPLVMVSERHVDAHVWKADTMKKLLPTGRNFKGDVLQLEVVQDRSLARVAEEVDAQAKKLL